LKHCILAVGKLKERYWKDAAADYIRRIGPYARLEVVEVSESRIPDGATRAEEAKVKDKEALAILDRLGRREGIVVVLDRHGTPLDSIELAEFHSKQLLEGCKEITWIIGGPMGLAPSIIEKADWLISFSKLTFTHQMMRIILLEQIYRSSKIIHNQPYHR
jgi:23S rRNA (pseudouridine1915-N3)-methyltransferase